MGVQQQDRGQESPARRVPCLFLESLLQPFQLLLLLPEPLLLLGDEAVNVHTALEANVKEGDVDTLAGRDLLTLTLGTPGLTFVLSVSL